MPLEQDNDAERQARIERVLMQLRETQQRVERIAAETRDRAAAISRNRSSSRSNESPKA